MNAIPPLPPLQAVQNPAVPQTTLSMGTIDEREYRECLEIALDGFWVADALGNLLNVNQTLCTVKVARLEESKN